MDNYDYILKLHTKNYQTEGPKDFIGYKCRNNCFDSMLRSKKQFKKCMMLLNNKNVGMLGSHKYLLTIDKEYQDKHPLYCETCARLNIKNQYGHSIGGTMFMCKASLMKIVQDFNLKEGDFSPSLKTGDTGTLAHVMEMIFGLIVENQGYEVYGVKYK